MSKKYKQRIILNIIENNAEWEQDSGENLHEKFNDNEEGISFERNDLIPINIPTPTSLDMAQNNKVTIMETVKMISAVSGDSILYIIGHSDPDSKRLSGLEVSDWAEIIGSTGNFNLVKRIHIVGCHGAGEVKSSIQALSSRGTLPYSVTGFFSFAGLLHDYLKRYRIFTQVAAYCSYVRISPFGEIRTGFDENGARTRHSEATKVVFSWDTESLRTMAFTR